MRRRGPSSHRGASHSSGSMSLFVIDTDIFSLYDNGHPAVLRNIVRHANDRLSLATTTVDELVSGWQAAIGRARKDTQIANAHFRLATIIELMAGWSILPMTVPAIARHNALLRAKLQVKS